MSLLSVGVKSLRRLSNSKIRRHKAVLTQVVRYKINATMLENEKVSRSSMELNFSWLSTVAPAFPIDGSKVKIIHEPSEFYNVLVQKCRNAKKRITLASLYLGVGKLEQDLLKTIYEAVKSSNNLVEVTILLDYMRGSRGDITSRHMLLPLIQSDIAHRCRVYLYHTPALRGYWKELMPDRFNELIGLQHMKIYLIDDTLIISGANLSNDYFKNRQDRYFVIEDCPELCDFYCKLVNTVTEFSFILLPNGHTSYSKKMESHPFESSEEFFIKEASNKINNFLNKELAKSLESRTSYIPKKDTCIFPLIQMAQLNIRHDSPITLKLLETAPPGATLKLATGYFNLTSEYSTAILKSCQANCQMLTAHPTANGFYGAKGVAHGIPAAYTQIEESFFKMCDELKQTNRIKLFEFVKPGWTFHAKGLWYYMPGQDKPSFTLMGSPNFGYRSVEKDLETQIALMTRNKDLQESLQKECQRLFDGAQPVSKQTFTHKDRLPPAWVRMAVYFFRYYF